MISPPPVLSTLSFCLALFMFFWAFRRKVTDGTHDTTGQDWLEEESSANFCTKKSLPNHILLTWQSENIPHVKDIHCEKLYKKILSYEQFPMADLSPYENIELKKQFGINYFNTLLHYEEVYHNFLRDLTKYAQQLQQLNYYPESCQVLEYAIILGCCSSLCYELLIHNYATLHHTEKLQVLIDEIAAKNLPQKIQDFAQTTLYAMKK